MKLLWLRIKYLWDSFRVNLLRRSVKKHYTLSPAGLCALTYMQGLLTGEDNYIQAYEDAIESIQKKIGLSRDETIRHLVTILSLPLQK